MLKKLRNFRGVSKLKLAALNILIKTLNPTDIDPLRIKFQNLDNDKTGFITPSELTIALENSNLAISQEEIQKIITEIDEHKNGKINYSEFLASMVNVQ